METVLITGGTGLIGKALSAALVEKGYRVIILTRNVEERSATGKELSYAEWDIVKQFIDPKAIETADHIIHLAGAGIADKRWTKKRKQEIINSRVDSSKLIAGSLQKISNKIKTVVSASAIGWYGPDPSVPNPNPFTENDPPYNDFLGTVCQQWEESISPVKELGKRLVIVRTAPVLSKEGGVVGKFKTPLRFGMATILGNGKQVMSWIHIDDLVNIYIAAIENKAISGVYNAVAPDHVTNKELVMQLARSRQRFFIPIHIPSFVLKMIAGELSVEVLKSCTVSTDKIRSTGFEFRFPVIGDALNSLK